MILIVSTCKERLSEGEFVRPIAGIAENLSREIQVKHFRKVDNVDKYDHVIICGTALKDNFAGPDSFEWLNSTKIPVLGICSGMQIIAQVFGGALVLCKEIGMIKIDVKKNSLFSNEKVYALHNNAVRDLYEFDILARSEKCVQAIKHKSKNIYGVLFHPEVRNHELITNFLSL